MVCNAMTAQTEKSRIDLYFDKVRAILTGIFYLALLALTVRGWTPILLDFQPVLWRGLISGAHTGYKIPGDAFSPFRKILTRDIRATLVLDKPIEDDIEMKKIHYDAQNYLCPIRINADPEELIGIIFCSDPEIALERTRETGYRLIATFAPGKGMGIKETK